jgi:hypothetical protein
LVPGSVRTSSELAERNPNPNEDLEFPSIQFSDIVAATNNFSRACMIGRGGFGKVYKVTLRSAAYISFSKSELMNWKWYSRVNTQLLFCYSEGDIIRWSRSRRQEAQQGFWTRDRGIQEWSYLDLQIAAPEPGPASRLLHRGSREGVGVWVLGQ